MKDKAQPKRKRNVIGRTLDAASKATEVARDLVEFAEDGARMTVQIASDTARVAGLLAQDAALQMAESYLSRTTITMSLPESAINRQLRQMTEDHEHLDYITVHCGHDRLSVLIDGHYRRLVYTGTIEFDVLECKVSREEQYLILRQVDAGVDAQLRQARPLANMALHRLAWGVSFLARRLPDSVDPVRLFLERVPGVTAEGPDLWRVALHKGLMLELLHNRSWMVDKLLDLGDLTVIPGLSLLVDSREMLQKLVSQFEIRSMRVQPGRLELLIGINT